LIITGDASDLKIDHIYLDENDFLYRHEKSAQPKNGSCHNIFVFDHDDRVDPSHSETDAIPTNLFPNTFNSCSL
jgi:hypothetical protein